MMSSAATSMLKPSTMVDSSGLSFTCFYPTKTVFPFISFPSKISSFHLSCCHSSAFSPPLSLKNKTPGSHFLTFVAQTSDWAQQEGKTITQDADEEIKWENEELDNPDSRISDWEGEGEDSIIEGSETEGESGEGGVFEEREVDEEPYAEPPEDAKIFVGNLPYDVDSEKLALIFEKAGIVEIAEVIYNRETDRSRGFGFVTMSSVEEADKAVEMFNRHDLEGRLLTVNKAAPQGARIERPPRAFDSSFRVYVGNLPWDVDGARLQKVFSEHGNVVDARVVYDRETGRSRGFGFVVMSDESGMNDAIDALDGQSLEGRSIRVSVAEERPRRSF